MNCTCPSSGLDYVLGYQLIYKNKSKSSKKDNFKWYPNRLRSNFNMLCYLIQSVLVFYSEQTDTVQCHDEFLGM